MNYFIKEKDINRLYNKPINYPDSMKYYFIFSLPIIRVFSVNEQTENNFNKFFKYLNNEQIKNNIIDTVIFTNDMIVIYFNNSNITINDSVVLKYKTKELLEYLDNVLFISYYKTIGLVSNNNFFEKFTFLKLQGWDF